MGRPLILKYIDRCIILRNWRKGTWEYTNAHIVVKIVAVVQRILECSSLEEIQNICAACKNPATVVAVHSSLLE